jgi:glutathione peroxidase-family protein
MKKIIILGLIAFLSSSFCLTGVYDFSVPKIEGGSYELGNSQGKKIMIITLPIQQNAISDSMLYCLDTLAASHSLTLTVIAVPSYEDGYTIAQKEQLKTWYRSKLGNNIIVTEGLYTRKTSGSQQYPLFQWLTHSGQNDVFDIDVIGPNHKFFVKENGELFGVLIPQSKISGISVQKTLQMQ